MKDANYINNTFRKNERAKGDNKIKKFTKV